ncbi:tetratricopeptide repeat protein [Sphingomonas sp. AOB5]|uniref:tetratricopeptide repeat protein n=1 Tax=Sphingomonas sp. AOB5 TaxID=3034017 RepID=UPI0023F824A2|nr:tetratricopeptide repeat protein [Sphingomonas sp. AOB5]MDF7774315.1 tetratricopeptide repeat protein [Sphingomonas sp. AOB5]
MSGWIMLAILGALTLAFLWAIGFPKRLWTVAATAVTLGATGYAWQGSPALPGHSVLTVEKRGEVDPGMIELREAMFGRYNFSYNYFAISDSMMRQGRPDLAVTAMRGAIAKGPGDSAVWTGLGMALAEHDRGVSPASRLAFDRAMELWPQHPGPPYFLGLYYAKMGQFVEARRWWAKAVELAPADASYRPALVEWLGRLDQVIAQQSGQQSGQQAAPQAGPKQP